MLGRIGPVYTPQGQPMVGAGWTPSQEYWYQQQLCGVSNAGAGHSANSWYQPPMKLPPPIDWLKQQDKDVQTWLESALRSQVHAPVIERAIRVSIERLKLPSPVYRGEVRYLLAELELGIRRIDLIMSKLNRHERCPEYALILKDALVSLAALLGRVPISSTGPQSGLRWSAEQSRAYWQLKAEVSPTIRAVDLMSKRSASCEPDGRTKGVLAPLLQSVVNRPEEHARVPPHGVARVSPHPR